MAAEALVRSSEGVRVFTTGANGLVEICQGMAMPDPSAIDRFSGTFQIDDAIRRNPELLLLPDLARRNPAGSRHRKRVQDVEELLAAGIDVWSTLSVGQLESMADIVERISATGTEERIPDSVFDSADEVELIDLAPDALLEREDEAGPSLTGTTAGTVSRAALLALREVTLRRAADRLNAGAGQAPGRGQGTSLIWPTEERLLVCVGPSPTSPRVIRTASRMARAMRATWIAVTVEPAKEAPAAEKQRILRNLHLAESLGAKTTTLTGGDTARGIVDYAREKGATKIIIGKTGRRRWPFGWRPSLVDQVIAASGEIDVYVIRGSGDADAGQDRAAPRGGVRVWGYLGAVLILAAATGIAALFGRLGFNESTFVLAYILGVTAAAVWFGRGPAMAASVGAVLLYNFFFTEPRYTLRVHDSGYVVTFAVMMTIGVLVSTLTARVREQSIAARQRERRTEQLFELSRDLSSASGESRIAATAALQLGGILSAAVAVLLPDEHGVLRPVGTSGSAYRGDDESTSAAAWAFEHGRRAGFGTDTHGDLPVLFLPLVAPPDRMGVLAIRAEKPEDLVFPEGRRLAESCAAQVSAALQRDHLVEKVHQTLSQAESERVRSAMLSSISHDFRTPLSAIAGFASSLLESGDRLDPEERKGLLQSLYGEAIRLARLIDSILQMTRIEAGQLAPNKEWNVVEDLVGAALTRMARQLSAHGVATRMTPELPMIRVDGGLVELVLANLIENAARYSPEGSEIEVGAYLEDGMVKIEVADGGPGLSEEEQARAFEKFYRGPRWRADGSRGAGLGLAICAAVAKLHGGRIEAGNRAEGGARFVLALPLEEQPPALLPETPEDAPEERRT